MDVQASKAGLKSKLFGFTTQCAMLIACAVAWAVCWWTEHPDTGFFGAMTLLLAFAMVLIDFTSPAGFELARSGRKLKATPATKPAQQPSPGKGESFGFWETVIICGLCVAAAYALTLF